MKFVNDFFSFDTIEEMDSYLARPAITVQLVGTGWVDATNQIYIGDPNALIEYLNKNKFRVNNPTALSSVIKERLK